MWKEESMSLKGNEDVLGMSLKWQRMNVKSGEWRDEYEGGRGEWVHLSQEDNTKLQAFTLNKLHVV